MDYDELIMSIGPSEEGLGNIKSVLPVSAASVYRTDWCNSLMVNLRTTYNEEGKTEQTNEVQPNNDLQFITITDPSQSQIPKNKRTVRSQAMRYARNRVRSPPHGNQSSLHLGASAPPVLKVHSLHIQPPGSATGSCNLSNDVYRNQGCHQASSIDLVAAAPRCYSPVSVLGFGRVDPFGMFPVEMSPYMSFLVDYCK